MTYLISQLWLYLLCAGILGLLLGWVIWGWRGRQMVADLRAEQERERSGLKRAFETEKLALEEDRAAAFLARDEALKVKASLFGELEGERKAASEAKAQIGRLNQAELASRGEFERQLTTLQGQVEKERSTSAEAKQAVEAIRSDVRQELQQKQTALSNEEKAKEALRVRLEKLEAEAKQTQGSLEKRLEDERKAKTGLQIELRRDRAELSEAKDAMDEVSGDLTRQLQAKQSAVTSAENAAVAAKREAESTRSELARLKAETGKGNDGALKSLEQSLSEERRAKAALEAEVERFRSELAAMSDRGQGQSAEAGRLRRELEEVRKRQSGLEEEAERLRALLSQRESARAKPKTEKFTTDAPRPASLFDRRPDVVDDLKEVKGIGPVMERILNENGCYHFKQLANFSKRDIEWISAALGSFPDRIERDNWVGQAQTLYTRKYGQRHDVGAVRTLETVS